MTRLYQRIWQLAAPLIHLLFPARCDFGGARLPEGPCIVCANHSSMKDPIYLAIVLGPREQLYFMAKAELFARKHIGAFLTGLGAFPVRRGEADITAVKTAIRHLRDGHKIGMFPEGTRVGADDAVAAKTGAVALAARTRVPIVPVYLPREKKFFRRITIRVGEPYLVDGAADGNTEQLAADLMERIYALGREGT